MIQGVIFDMDGLMFDTERIWATLWEPALAGLGLSYKEGLDEAARGTAGDSMRAVLRRFYGPDCDPDRIIEALHEQGETAFLAPPPKKPGLDEILAWLEQRHIPMVVASSSRMASIRHHLDGWGLTHYFKAVISGEQFISSKPDPEIFYRAAEMLGTAPEHTLVLEDSYNGVRAGAAGGFVYFDKHLAYSRLGNGYLGKNKSFCTLRFNKRIHHFLHTINLAINYFVDVLPRCPRCTDILYGLIRLKSMAYINKRPNAAKMLT